MAPRWPRPEKPSAKTMPVLKSASSLVLKRTLASSEEESPGGLRVLQLPNNKRMVELDLASALKVVNLREVVVAWEVDSTVQAAHLVSRTQAGTGETMLVTVPLRKRASASDQEMLLVLREETVVVAVEVVAVAEEVPREAGIEDVIMIMMVVVSVVSAPVTLAVNESRAASKNQEIKFYQSL